MAPALLAQGITNIRDAIRGIAGTFITNVFVTDDSVAFNSGQTTANPTGGATTVLNKAATATVVDFQTIDYTIGINGTTEFTGKQIWCIGVAKAGAATDAMSRTVRALSIGVQAGDSYTVGVRAKNQDDS